MARATAAIASRIQNHRRSRGATNVMINRTITTLPGLAACVLIAALGSGCTGSSQDAPSAAEPPFSSNPTVVHGSEHLGWGQVGAADSYQFLAYVDGAPQDLADAACQATADPAQFNCTASLPTMAAGTHRLRMTAAIQTGTGLVESPKSAPVDVLMQPTGDGTAAGSATTRAAPAAISVDNTRLAVDTLAQDLDSPSGLATTPDGRVFLVEQTGAVRVWQSGTIQEPPAFNITNAAGSGHGALFGLALDPDFANNGGLYVAYTSVDAGGSFANRILRLRALNNTLGLAASIFTDRTATAPTLAPRIAFGPDGKLYAAFPGATGIPSVPSSYAGKMLRLEADGSTPRDNPGSSPVFSADARIPLAFAWQPGVGQLWQVSRDQNAQETLRAIGPGGAPAAPAMTFLPAIGPSAAAFYSSNAIASFAGDLFVSALAGQELLRVHFDPQHPERVVSQQQLLQGAVGRIADLAIGSDGALYFCTNNRGATTTVGIDDRLMRVRWGGG
jgi:aldose sugar dehydrogenase